MEALVGHYVRRRFIPCLLMSGSVRICPTVLVSCPTWYFHVIYKVDCWSHDLVSIICKVVKTRKIPEMETVTCKDNNDFYNAFYKRINILSKWIFIQECLLFKFLFNIFSLKSSSVNIYVVFHYIRRLRGRKIHVTLQF